MASQMAQILNNYRRTMPQAGAGMRAGVENYVAGQERQRVARTEAEQTKRTNSLQDAQESRAAAKEGREVSEFERKKRNNLMREWLGPISTADTPNKWASAQESGFIPKKLKFEQREPFIMTTMTESERLAREKEAGQTTEVFDPSSPTGTRHVPRSEAAGQPGKPKSGTAIDVGPDGTVSVRQGPGAGGFDKKNRRAIEKKAFDAQESVARLRSIKSAFQPKLLQAGPKIRAKFAEAKNFFDIDVSEDEKKLVEDMTTLYRRTSETLSLYIKDISGAAVSEQEAKRLSKALPTDADSPMVFEAKLKDVMKSTTAALWRANYALANGLAPDASGISLYDMDGIVEKEGQRIELDIRKSNPGMDEQTIDAQVSGELQKIFGSMQ